jgi:hypothetical protein
MENRRLPNLFRANGLTSNPPDDERKTRVGLYGSKTADK